MNGRKCSVFPLLAALGVLLASALVPDAARAVNQLGLPDFTGLVSKYSKAVVNISTTSTRTLAEMPGLENIPKDNPFYDFYRRFFEGQPQEREGQSLGSGFIISTDGYVITNAHVVQGADKIVVRLIDRREYEAKLIGTDAKADVAVLKIDATGLPTVELGLDHDLGVGEWVLAIGSPFGFDYSVTAGIVSAIGRSLPRGNYVPFIQTDVAINPGNSGGPLFNLDGEVVGVNAQIFTRTGQYNGLSFAIPIDVAWDVAEQLRTRGRVSRGWLGVMIQDVTQELAESFGMDRPRGALIAKVLPGSPAEDAGFEVGDIVLEFSGHDVTRSSDLPPIVGRTRVETTTPVKVLRRGQRIEIEVVIAELPEDGTTLAATRPGSQSTASARLGLTVADLKAEQRREQEVPEGGVVVTEVGHGPGKAAGIEAGDIIVIFNNVEVENVDQFQALVKELPVGKAASVLVQRGASPIFLALKTEK